MVRKEIDITNVVIDNNYTIIQCDNRNVHACNDAIS